MATLEKPMSAGIEQIEANAAQLQQLNAEVEALLDLTPTAPSPHIPWAWLVAGLISGLVGGAALALTLTGALG